jgi:methionyl-tRNA synthetase
MKKKFYITTAIDYVNAEPHIGHAYQKIVADTLARWHKLQGEDVFFVTGTDEHGKKLEITAKSNNKDPKKFVDEMSLKFKEAWRRLNIQSDRFIRTTDKDHKKVVKEFIEKCYKNEDIYKGKYKGLYCVNCEAYYTEKDAPNSICPTHQKQLEKLEEESYFFKLSKYQDFLLKLYKEHPEFILPESRRNEIINRVKEGLNDFSISRTSFSWGIQFPLDKKHITYVWFDALINYYTATRQKGKEKYWPADLHLLGKDNAWFHTVYWPAMLKSAGIEIPKTVFAHGFLTFNGQKISKSLGNAISIKILTEKYGTDAVRYFCLKQFPFSQGDDGDFSEESLIARNNNELANELGNLVSRTINLAIKKSNGIIKKDKIEFNFDFNKIKAHMDNYELTQTLVEIFKIIQEGNKYINKNEPWKLESKEFNKVIYNVLELLRVSSILLYSFTPESAEKIAEQLGTKIKSFKDLKLGLIKEYKVKKREILFKKIE